MLLILVGFRDYPKLVQEADRHLVDPPYFLGVSSGSVISLNRGDGAFDLTVPKRLFLIGQIELAGRILLEGYFGEGEILSPTG